MNILQNQIMKPNWQTIYSMYKGYFAPSKCNSIAYVIFIVFICINPGLNVFGQAGSSGLKNVIPPSPNTASLGKYGDIPISLYTGIPNISIPLYEIKDGDLSLPVSLSYHAAGVKVEEIPSSVGLGWTLNATGIVGRSVRGLPDELANWQPQPSNNTIENIAATGNVYQLAQDVDMQYRDGEADLYYYNFSTQSGKFFYDQAGGTHTYPSKNIAISSITNGWRIVTEGGTVYSFTKQEDISSSGCVEGEDQIVPTAWYLTSIKSSDGKREITFTYESVWIVSQTLLGQKKYYSLNGAAGCLTSPLPCLGTNQSRTHRLTRIDFSDGYLKFNYNNVRCDLVDDKSLDLIEIYTKSNTLVKKFSFAYSYFGNNADGVNRVTENNKRLKLVSLTEQGSTTLKPPYLFEYNESIELPSRISYAQDHWGYYNGKNNNPDLIATFTTPVFSGSLIAFPGADRKADASKTQAAILTKVKFPTGGETLFTYENNTVSDNRVEPDYTEDWTSLSASNSNVSSLPSPYESWPLVIPSQGASITFSVSGLGSPLWQGCDIVQCQVIKDNNYSTPYRTIDNGLHGTSEVWPAGTYKLKLVTQCGVGSVANFNVYINAKIATTQSLAIRTVGGLRIKQIEDKAGDGSQSVIKNYKYYPENDPTHSSGVLINFPDHGYDLGVQSYTTDAFGIPNSPITYCSYRVRQSFSNYPLATTQGSYVGYSHVIEDLGNNGESRHSFVTYENFIGGNFPFAPVESYDWRRGFESGTKYYAKKNNQLVLIKEISNIPFSSNELRIYGIKTGRNGIVLRNGSAPTQEQPAPVYSIYPTITEFYTPGSTIEKIYDQNDPTKFIETRTDYTYNPQHLQLVQSRTSTSSSDQTIKDEITVNSKYPFDYTFSGAPAGPEALAIKKLQDLHIVNTPVEQYTVRQKRNSSNNQISDQRVISSAISIYTCRPNAAA